jgi:hypothetical protein
MLRDGDTLKITVDRLGRSVLHLVTLGAELRGRGVRLHVAGYERIYNDERPHATIDWVRPRDRYTQALSLTT